MVAKKDAHEVRDKRIKFSLQCNTCLTMTNTSVLHTSAASNFHQYQIVYFSLKKRKEKSIDLSTLQEQM